MQIRSRTRGAYDMDVLVLRCNLKTKSLLMSELYGLEERLSDVVRAMYRMVREILTRYDSEPIESLLKSIDTRYSIRFRSYRRVK